MNVLSATDVRKNWSLVIDNVVREKPVYVKRTRDNVALINIDTLNEIMSAYRFYTNKFKEADGSITLSTVDMDIVVNEKDEESAKKRLAAYIKEYAEEYYDNYEIMSKAPNRKSHIPYVFKALTLDVNDIEGEIVCQNGKN